MRSTVSSISPVSYEQDHWPRLSGLLHRVLLQAPGDLVSFEEISRIVFSLCWFHHQPRLLGDVIGLVRGHLVGVARDIEGHVGGKEARGHVDGLLGLVGAERGRYLSGCGGLVNALAHLERTYVCKHRLESLSVLLPSLFGQIVLASSFLQPRLLRILQQVPVDVLGNQNPAFPAELISALVLEYWKLNPATSEVNQRLFSLVIPEAAEDLAENSWHFQVQKTRAPTVEEDGLDVDIDVGEEESPASWLQGDSSENWVDTQVLGKRREMDEDPQDGGVQIQSKRQHMFS